MKSYSYTLSAAIVLCAGTAAVCILGHRRLNRCFWASISEAGARFPRTYAIGSATGGVVLTVGLYQFIIGTYGEMNLRKIDFSVCNLIFTYVGTVFMMACYVFQGVVKINLYQEYCIHRKAATAFFVSGLIMCVEYTHLYNVVNETSMLRKGVRWVVFVAIIANLWIQYVVFKQYNLAISTNKLIKSMDYQYVSWFSYMQYSFVATLFIALLSIM